MLRYLRRLESNDLSLTTLDDPARLLHDEAERDREMLPVTWPEFGKLHPFAPREQAAGYREMFAQLEALARGDHRLSRRLAPAECRLAGRIRGAARHPQIPRVARRSASRHLPHPDFRARHESGQRGDGRDEGRGRRVRRMATSTSPICARKRSTHSNNLAALMVTYPSTHGVFEETIVEICEIIHEHGGQVYMDGANMNAQVGLTSPGRIGADVCHLNLHKTFCIPHGGGGPGVGPIGVAEHLAPFLSAARALRTGSNARVRISAAPWGSASILTISWMYIRMMGGDGLTEATKFAILNANYIAKRLDPLFPGALQRRARTRRARVHPRSARLSKSRPPRTWRSG